MSESRLDVLVAGRALHNSQTFPEPPFSQLQNRGRSTCFTQRLCQSEEVTCVLRPCRPWAWHIIGLEPQGVLSSLPTFHTKQPVCGLPCEFHPCHLSPLICLFLTFPEGPG